MGSGGPTEATRSCSRTPTSRPSTSPSRTPCTWSGRCGRSRRGSTCSARSRSRGVPRRSSGPSSSPTRRGSCSRKPSCGDTTRRRRRSPRCSTRARSVVCGSCEPPSASGSRRARAGDVRLSPELDGGALMDVGCYCVNAVRLLAGEPTRVHGEQAIGESGVDVAFAGTLRCADDVLAHFDCGFVLPDRAALEAVGEEGSLVVGDPWHARTPGIELRRGDASQPSSRSRSSRELVPARARRRLRRDRGRARPRCSDGTMRSARPGPSTRSTARPTAPVPSMCPAR